MTRPAYEVRFRPRPHRDLERIPPPDRDRILDAIEPLAENPRPRGSLKIEDDTYRIRVGSWRVIYLVSDEQRQVVILRVARRSKSTYRDL